MSEWIVRDLAIEEYPEMQIRATLEHCNQSYVKWCDLSEEKNLKIR